VALHAAAERAVPGAKEPRSPPIDKQSSFRATKARLAIIHCVEEIKLSPDQCIAIEVEAANRLQQRPDIAREHLGQISIAIRQLTPWFEQFLELYKKEIDPELRSDELTTTIPDVPLATPSETRPAESQTTCSEMTVRPALRVATLALAGQRGNDVLPRRGRGRPPGSRDTQPRKKKRQAPDCHADPEIRATQSQTNAPKSAKSQIRDTGTEPGAGLTP
jgi:hypothetical protein